MRVRALQLSNQSFKKCKSFMHAYDDKSAIIRRILIVEDNALVALDLEDILTKAGYFVLGPATTVKEALNMIAELHPDAATLDGKLGENSVSEIAAALTAEGVPFVFVSGYGPESMPEAFRHIPLVPKPYTPDSIIEAVRLMFDPSQSGPGEAG